MPTYGAADADAVMVMVMVKQRVDGAMKEKRGESNGMPVRCPRVRKGARRPDRFSQKEQNSSVLRHPSATPR